MPGSHDQHQSEKTASIRSLLGDWASVHRQSAIQNARLVGAEAELAAASLLQIVILGIFCALLLASIWAFINAGIFMWLLHHGIHPALVLLLLVAIHIVLLVATLLGIRASAEGLSFQHTRELVRRFAARLPTPSSTDTGE